MPGELSNVLAGRVCNLFNFRGPNFTTDAACASGLAAMNAAVGGLLDHQYDAVLSGGVDRNNGVNGFVKFCKIGALSATGTRPFDAGADGFVMGEGAAVYVLKRLADAERDGDRIYAVLLPRRVQRRQGQGHHRPQPGRAEARRRAGLARAGLDPAVAGMIEAHGTSTRVGDLHETRGRCRQRVRPTGAAPQVDRAGLGQVQHRPPQGRRRRRGAVQGRHVPAREGAAAEPAFQHTQPERRLGDLPVRGEHRTARVPGRPVRRPGRRGERVRLRRDELPRRPGGVRARPAPLQRAALLRGCGHSAGEPRRATPAPRRGGRRRRQAPPRQPRRRRGRRRRRCAVPSWSAHPTTPSLLPG